MLARSIGAFFALTLSLCPGLWVCGVAQAATPAQIDGARNQGLAWLFTHQTSDGQWQSPGGLPVQTTAAALEALRNAGVARGHFYAGAVAWLRNAEAASNDALARQIMALSATGTDTQGLITALLAKRTDTSKSWGAFAKYQGSFPDTALAMDAILMTNTGYADAGTTLGFIAAKQNADGGWPYAVSAPTPLASQIIPTAYSTLNLSRAKLAGWGVDGYITKAVNWLVARKKADNGFAEDGAATAGNVFETALVYLALAKAKQANNAAAVGAQAVLDGALDFLVNKQAADGSWGDDALQTALALQALPAVTLADGDKDGIPDGVEPLVATNAAVPDGRDLLVGNGEAVTGTTAPIDLGSRTLDTSMSITLAGNGGSGPYTWTLVSGSIPSGTSLNTATGVISGVPTVAGTYNFTYQVQDGQGNADTRAVQLAIYAEETDREIPTLPEWGVIVMMTLLLLAGLRQQARGPYRS